MKNNDAIERQNSKRANNIDDNLQCKRRETCIDLNKVEWNNRLHLIMMMTVITVEETELTSGSIATGN